MTNKIISKLIRGVLLLETQFRGPRIKYSAWRAKIIKSQYIQSHCAYPIRKVPPVVEAIADTHRKAAYLIMLKAAYTSIGGTFFENESHRETYKQWANEAYTLGIDLLPLGIVTDKKPGHLFPLNNIKIIINSEKGWLMNGKNIEGNFKQKNITLDEVNSYFVFTFVRNPFTRLVSFFKNLYSFQNGKYHARGRKSQFNFWLHEVSSFSELAYKTSKLSDCYLDVHALPQHLRIDSFQASGGKIDFIGKF